MIERTGARAFLNPLKKPGRDVEANLATPPPYEPYPLDKKKPKEEPKPAPAPKVEKVEPEPVHKDT